MKSGQKEQGFTIVELLIVIVVIAILAAITIVAYTGVRDSATRSKVQSELAQANKKIQSYAVQNAETYPADLQAAGRPSKATSDLGDYAARQLLVSPGH